MGFNKPSKIQEIALPMLLADPWVTTRTLYNLLNWFYNIVHSLHIINTAGLEKPQNQNNLFLKLYIVPISRKKT